jgi:heterodisulfide reductase subunit A
LITYADLEAIQGTPGNYRVKIRKRARSVDPEICTGCGSCLNNCPVTIQGIEQEVEESITQHQG